MTAAARAREITGLPASLAEARVDRAWERLRLAIIKNLDDPNDSGRPEIERLSREFAEACGEQWKR